MNRLLLILVGLALALVGNLAAPSRVFAQQSVEKQNQFAPASPPWLMEPTKGGASSVVTSPITSALMPLSGNPTFTLTALHTVAGGTTELHVVLWAATSTADVYSQCGVVDKVTLTADTTVTEVVNSVTYYPALELLDYASRGATHVEIRPISNPSGGGSVRVRLWGSPLNPGKRD